MNRILTIAITASLLSAPVMADPSPAASGLRTSASGRAVVDCFARALWLHGSG